MATYIEYRERLKAQNLQGGFEEYDDKWKMLDPSVVVRVMKRSIINLVTNFLYGKDGNSVFHFLLEMELDGKKMTFNYPSENEDGLLDENLQRALHQMTKADQIDIYMVYEKKWMEGEDCFEVSELLEKCHDDMFDFIDYVQFNDADCAEGAGILTVYGKRGSSVHRGRLEYSKVDQLPKTADWYQPTACVIYESPDFTVNDEDIARAEELGHNLLSMVPDYGVEVEIDGHMIGTGDYFEIDDNVLYFILNQPELDTPEKVDIFIRNLQELATLIQIPEGTSRTKLFVAPEFNDASYRGFNLLEIRVFFNGQVELWTAEAYKEQ